MDVVKDHEQYGEPAQHIDAGESIPAGSFNVQWGPPEFASSCYWSWVSAREIMG